MTIPLDVDGPRPAITWVSSLPRGWTTTRERIVLMLLASDTYDREPPFECSPSLDQLAAWAGEWKGSVSDALTALMTPTDRRPALIEKRPGKGRQRSVYVLLTDTSWDALAPTDTPTEPTPDAALQSDTPDHNDPDSWSDTPDHYDDSQAVDNPRSGRRSGRASGRSSGRGAPTTPYPSLPTSPTSVENPRQTARDALRRARGPARSPDVPDLTVVTHPEEHTA